ncbi:MAG: hypothetical protein HY758_10890 [Nitrospirae bacterium]|nr:hypothetical protein [Nitrospirota bacterium]
MKKLSLLAVVAVLAGLFSIVAPAVADAQEFCMQGVYLYRISYEQNGNTYDVHGDLINSADTGLAGSAWVNSSGHIIIAFSESFPWGTGWYIHPIGTTVIDYTAGTYDTTYHGDNTTTVNNFIGAASVVACPPYPPQETLTGGPNNR